MDIVLCLGETDLGGEDADSPNRLTVRRISNNILVMSITEIEAEIVKLPPAEVDKLMTWLEEYHAEIWDKQITHDLESGKLDSLLDEVDKEIDAGLVTPL